MVWFFGFVVLVYLFVLHLLQFTLHRQPVAGLLVPVSIHHKLVTVFVFLISSPTCKQITSSARRRLFRFSLFIYLYDLIYLTFIYIVWHDFILNTGAKI